MRKIIILYILALLSVSCIHQYPDQNTTQVNVFIDLEVDSSLPLYQEITRTTGTAQKRRFIIDVLHNGKVMAEKRLLTTEAEETGEGKYSIPLSLQLEAQEYTFVVWNDYVPAQEGSHAHFITEDLSNVFLHEDYCNEPLHREAFCGTADADLTAYRDMENAQVRQHILLKRPQAKYAIISTDMEEFLTRIQAKGKPPGNYRAKVSYEYYLPTGYNVTGNVLCQSRAGMGFTVPCTLEADEAGECGLTEDFVLMGAEDTYISLTLEIINAEEKVVSRTTGVQVPLKQGHLTLVKGKFLTTMMNPGISIDPGYNGEFNIVIK